MASVVGLVQWTFLAVGVGLLGAGGVQAAGTRAFLGTARPAEGEVHSLRKHHTGKGTLYGPVVRYRGEDGAERELSPETWSSPPAYQLGERVTVLVDPADPAAARLSGFFELWGWPAILAGAGALLALAGGGLRAARRRPAVSPRTRSSPSGSSPRGRSRR